MKTAINTSHSHSLKTLDERRLSVDLCPTITLLLVTIITPGINLSSIGDSQAMQNTNSHVNDSLTPETLHHSWLPDMSVSTMSQSVVITLPPKSTPHLTLKEPGRTEHHTRSRLYPLHSTSPDWQGLHNPHCHPSKLAKISVTPAENHSFINKCQGLSIYCHMPPVQLCTLPVL